jgi:AbiV family abortive infection protein
MADSIGRVAKPKRLAKERALLGLSPMQYFEGAQKTVANARLQYECAMLLAEQRQAYGPATGLMIQAWEEANKAGTLMAAALEVQSAVTDLPKVFSEHRTKHVLGLIALMPETAMKIMKTANARRAELASSPLTLEEMDPNGELQWWSKAKWLRVDGFYVDFDEGRWRSPKEITGNNFEISKRVAGSRLADIEQELAALGAVFS